MRQMLQEHFIIELAVQAHEMATSLHLLSWTYRYCKTFRLASVPIKGLSCVTVVMPLASSKLWVRSKYQSLFCCVTRNDDKYYGFISVSWKAMRIWTISTSVCSAPYIHSSFQFFLFSSWFFFIFLFFLYHKYFCPCSFWSMDCSFHFLEPV
jgi:hypothetical protein